jgi:hypothetical protein
MNDIYKPFKLIAAYEVADKESLWLRDRYFPCNPSTDLFKTDEVYVEIKGKGGRLTAPFVVPSVGGRYITRDGYKTSRIAPPFMGLKSKLTIDDLEDKGFGEAYFTEANPVERARKLLVGDMEEMERRFARTEEMMCAKLLTGNGYELKHYGAEYADSEKFKNYKIQFFDGKDDPTLYTPEGTWGKTATNIEKDIFAMIRMLEENGAPATDLIVSWDVAEAICENEVIREKIKTFSGIHLMQGGLNPEVLPNGVTKVCTLNIYGRVVTVYSYTEKYVDPETGKDTLYIPEKTAILTAPNCGKMLYGCVKQMDPDTKEFQWIAAKRVPKMHIDVDNDSRDLRICSRPVVVPSSVNPFVHATVL